MAHNPGFLKLVTEVKKNIRECTVADVLKKISDGEKFHFIDVREESEWQAGHAKNAVYMSKGVIERDIETKIPDKNSEIILYCGGGFRSALVAESLQKMGYKNVISMDGGWKEWKEKGPVES